MGGAGEVRSNQSTERLLNIREMVIPVMESIRLPQIGYFHGNITLFIDSDMGDTMLNR